MSGLLLAAAAVAAWGAIQLHDAGLDPHWSAVGTAGFFAAGFSLFALFKIIQAARHQRNWVKTSGWFVIAIASLAVLELVAFATRLGG
jgi:hypothetical protein